ncbi:hypothetical protein NEOC65_001412 [Neochlamydia sp. AcF65]|nr:hypothetical protein [Neochlamydia sp. AcF65]
MPPSVRELKSNIEALGPVGLSIIQVRDQRIWQNFSLSPA